MLGNKVVAGGLSLPDLKADALATCLKLPLGVNSTI